MSFWSFLKKNTLLSPFINLAQHGFNMSEWGNISGSVFRGLESSSKAGTDNYFDSIANKLTGAAPTPVDAWNRSNIVEDRDLQNLREDTAYQRQVADMKAAGINPAMMYGGTGAAGASSTMGQGSNAPGADLSSFVQLLSVPAQIKSINASADAARAKADSDRADAALKEEQTNAYRIDNKYREKLKEAELEGEQLSNKLTRGQIREIEHKITIAENNAKESASNAKSAEERAIQEQTVTLLRQLEYDQAVKLAPLAVEYQKAANDRERSLARSAFLQKCYDEHVLSKDVAQAMEKQSLALCKTAEERAATESYFLQLKRGVNPEHIDTSNMNFWHKIPAVVQNYISDSVAGILGACASVKETVPLPFVSDMSSK